MVKCPKQLHVGCRFRQGLWVDGDALDRDRKKGPVMAVQILKASEDYLETMLMMQTKHGYVRSVDVAEHLGDEAQRDLRHQASAGKRIY